MNIYLLFICYLLDDVEKFNRVKGKAKAMIAIGGSSMSDQFSITAANDQYQDIFVRSVVNFFSKYQFDGIMLDWYGIQEKDSVNLDKLLDKFDEMFSSTPYIMGITLPATEATFNYYDVPRIVS